MKKSFALLFVLTLVISLMSGCGGDSSSQVSGSKKSLSEMSIGEQKIYIFTDNYA